MSDNGKLQSAAGMTVLFAACTLVTMIAAGMRSAHAWLTLWLDLAAALVVFAPALALGITLVSLFGWGKTPLRWRLLLGFAVGTGALALLVLALGMAGLLHRPLWLAVFAALIAGGTLRIRHFKRNTTSAARGTRSAPSSLSPQSLWLLLLLCAPFLALGLAAATNAPGSIRPEEGFGYDVLEYHVQAPREFLENGRIAYLPHNVYANFPSNVEMFYLLTMLILDDPIGAATACNVVHLFFGILFVWAVWVTGREFSSAAGLLGAVAAGTAGWLVYLAGLAYVELALLFYGATALGCLFRAKRESLGGLSDVPKRDSPDSEEERAARRRSLQWLAAGGLCAGFACGCKYTGAVMIAAPLAILIPFFVRHPPRGRRARSSVFVLAAVAGFAPWLAKNAAYTGNPVFPLANSVFRCHPPGWNAESDQRWSAGHRVPPGESSVPARLAALWRHVPADSMQRFSPLVLILPFAGFLGRRHHRQCLLLWMLLLMQLLVWLAATHLYARFAVVFLIPLAVLSGVAADSFLAETKASAARLSNAAKQHRERIVFLIVLSALGSLYSLAMAWRTHGHEQVVAVPPAMFVDGRVPGYEYIGFVNRELPPDARVLLVGEARAFYFLRPVDYCVVFNDCPFLRVTREAPDDAAIVSYLLERGYTHVLVHWSEVHRLRRTYGLAGRITPELFQRLSHAGLGLVRTFTLSESDRPYVDIWHVSRTGENAERSWANPATASQQNRNHNWSTSAPREVYEEPRRDDIRRERASNGALTEKGPMTKLSGFFRVERRKTGEFDIPGIGRAQRFVRGRGGVFARGSKE